MKIQKIQFYTVEGTGKFPIDMLRYDMAWPDAPDDSGKITSPPAGTYQVRLNRVTCFNPNAAEDRWASMGWKIIPSSILNLRRIA